MQTDPAEGTNVKRPARVSLLVSTGPPKRPVPSLDGLGAEDAADVLESAGFSPVVEERAETGVPVGTILGVDPAPGTRAPAGSTVTLVVAREPRWEASTSIDSTEDASPPPLLVPAGARLVLTTDDTSPLGLWGGTVDVELGGDAEGDAEVYAGDTLVLADVSDGDRTIEVSLDVDGLRPLDARRSAREVAPAHGVRLRVGHLWLRRPRWRARRRRAAP